MSYVANVSFVAWVTCIWLGFCKNWATIKPPINIPSVKNKFHFSFFQSYLNNEILAGMHTAQTWRSVELMPNFLLPISSKVGTVSPTKIPATAQCQGCLSNSIELFNLLKK